MRQFKVGDRVKLLDNWGIDLKKGQIKIIKSIQYYDGFFKFSVKCSSGSAAVSNGGVLFFINYIEDSKLELIKPSLKRNLPEWF